MNGSQISPDFHVFLSVKRKAALGWERLEECGGGTSGSAGEVDREVRMGAASSQAG